ncbi:MAG: amidophosphoribosyltransferase [Candidatus ainarchaeum sp.]|nr:amidophosphoribosyltransferase [Candidatus ainarchaeum sp.]
MKNIREECGIIAVYLKEEKEMGIIMYDGLMSIQHRGQDANGFVIYNKGNLERRVGLGLVSETTKEEDLKIVGNIGIGHTRYPTTGRCKIEDVQPVQYKNIALAHNGHVSNYIELRKELEEKGYEFRGTVDSEPFVYLIYEEMKKGKSIEEAVKILMEKTVGSYSVVAIINGKLVIFRDPHAIRPLVMGKRDGEYCFGSESVIFDVLGFEYSGQIFGGELLIIDNGRIEKKEIIKKEQKNCMFEYVYFSRPDSIINDLSVNDVRRELGKILAKEHPADADIVVPVPDTSRTAAMAFSESSGIPYDEGLIKNRYIGRTFIMMRQDKRREAVKRKLNPIKSVLEGKRIILIDDSIVRGTTMREIIKMVRKAGAKEVHLRITCPPIKHPCFYGVDMPTYEELIANNKEIEEIRKYLDVESLGYLSLDGLKKALGKNICTGCLNGEYFSEYVKGIAQKEKEKKGVFVGCSKC